MAEPREDGRASPAVQWSRAALALALLFGSLPMAGRLILGSWGFQEATGAAVLCLVLAAYLRVRGVNVSHPLPDDAAVLEQALEVAAAGRPGEAIALLTEVLQRNPRFWQALQYRGQLRLGTPGCAAVALEDFAQAIALAPGEPHLYVLRGHAFRLLGDEAAAYADYRAAAALGLKDQPG